MTSLERKEARYQRRKAKREAKKRSYYEQFDNIDKVANLKNFMKATRKAKNGVMWKPSVQRYMANDMYNAIDSIVKIKNDEDVRKGFICFDVVERGKKRHIQSVHISERVCQKALSQAVLQPVLAHNLIYDNGACLKGKGTQFAIDRITEHLHKHYKKYGNEGYALVFDFSGYFNSIPHEGIKAMHRNVLSDEALLRFSDRFIDAFDGDTGIGLGSEICQIDAVAYPNPMDHELKDAKGCHLLHRYMDDGVILSKSKEFLKSVKRAIDEKSKELGLVINVAKTQIVKLSRGFKFLKNRMVLTETGKVLRLPWKRSITRQRRKLKKFRELYDQGVLTIREILNPFFSWLGYMSKKTAHRSIRSMLLLFAELFPEYKEVLKWKPKRSMKQIGLLLPN